jgi:predicted nucleotidyltransferase
MNLTEAITHLRLSESVPGLSTAVDCSEDLIRRMRSALEGHGADGKMDVIACGSLARREYTIASDVDYLVIVNAMPEHPAAARELVSKVKDLISEEALRAGASGKDPGTSGLFARATGLFDVIERIGLQDDTNHTHTVRMEIVQESVSLLDPRLHADILGRAIRRYLGLFPVREDRPPRFLLNDMLRYWRQITIDYQAKAPLGGHESKAVLRHIKLLTTRKNLFASSILPLIAPRDDSVSWADYLSEIYASPPLARLAMVTQSAPESVRDAVRTVFSTIDLFVRATDSADKRAHFEALTWESRKEDPLYHELRQAADELQNAYEHIFLGGWTAVAENTRRYLLF